MTELIAVFIGQDAQEYWPIGVKSVAGYVDHILCIDGGSKDNTIPLIKEAAGDTPITILSEPYDQHDKKMNGKQRNKYLDWLKNNKTDSWVLVLDADEVAGDEIKELKKWLESTPGGVYNVRMHHFVSDLGHVDSTIEKHYTMGRLFKLNDSMYYPLTEHPVLSGSRQPGNGMDTDKIILWHLAYVQGATALRKRFHNHLVKSEMHTPEWLTQWYRCHLLGTFPVRALTLDEVKGMPTPLKEAFHL